MTTVLDFHPGVSRSFLGSETVRQNINPTTETPLRAGACPTEGRSAAFVRSRGEWARGRGRFASEPSSGDPASTHQNDFPMAPAEVGSRRSRSTDDPIHLGSAVHTVLKLRDESRPASSRRYSSLNRVSGGRAEVILGDDGLEHRWWFPLFGYRLADYERLFEEKNQTIRDAFHWKGGRGPRGRVYDTLPTHGTDKGGRPSHP